MRLRACLDCMCTCTRTCNRVRAMRMCALGMFTCIEKSRHTQGRAHTRKQTQASACLTYKLDLSLRLVASKHSKLDFGREIDESASPQLTKGVTPDPVQCSGSTILIQSIALFLSNASPPSYQPAYNLANHTQKRRYTAEYFKANF